MNFVLPAGQTGLTFPDIAPAFYRRFVADAGRLAQCSMVHLGGGYYRVNLADPGGAPCGLTWKIPGGSSGSYEYGHQASPVARVAPLRAAGLTQASGVILDAALAPVGALQSFVDGAVEALAWGFIETAAHDYIVSGWPVEALGRDRMVTWEYGGVIGEVHWTEEPAPLASGATNYRALDEAEIEALLDGYAPDPSLSTTNWRGVSPPNRYLNPEPQASGDEANPTMFVIPSIHYDLSSIEGCFEDTDPYREGWVDFAGHIDLGSGTGLFSQHVWPTLLEAFAAADNSRLVFLTEVANNPVPGGRRGDWYIEGFRVPFIGR